MLLPLFVCEGRRRWRWHVYLEMEDALRSPLQRIRAFDAAEIDEKSLDTHESGSKHGRARASGPREAWSAARAACRALIRKMREITCPKWASAWTCFPLHMQNTDCLPPLPPPSHLGEQ